MSHQLTFQPGDQAWHAMRAKALKSLKFFAQHVMGYQDLIPMRDHAHELMLRVVEGSTGCPEIDTAPYVLILVPRDWGKSALITKAYATQLLCKNPNTGILIFNEKEATASQFLESIKHQFDRNDLFRSLFPELIPASKQDTQWSGQKIIIPRTTGRSEPSVMVAGVGAAIAGNHPDIIFFDDIISREAAESARRGNWEVMSGVNRWVHQAEALLSNQSPFTRRMIFIGTHWYHDDTYEHIQQYFGSGHETKEWLLTVPVEGGRKQTLPVKRMGDLVVFERSVREEGQWSWPEKYDEERMLRLQAEDPVLFACNYENRPSTDATSVFRNEWLKSYTWLDKHTISYLTPAGVKQALHLTQCDIVMLIDPGGFGTRKSEDRARAAIVVVAHTPSGEYLLLDCWSDRDTYVACQHRAVALAKIYRPRKVGIEVAGQQRVFYDQLRQMLTATGLMIGVEELHTENLNKDDRILQMEPYFQRGLMYVGSGAGFAEFRSQYGQWPRAARRDILDALAYLPKLVRPRMVPTGNLTLRRNEEVKSYYLRRGLPPPPQPVLGPPR